MTAAETTTQRPEDDGRGAESRPGPRRRWGAAGAAALAVTAAVALTGAALGMRPEAVPPAAVAGAEITISSRVPVERRAGGTGGAQAFMPAQGTSEDLGCGPGSRYRYKG